MNLRHVLAVVGLSAAAFSCGHVVAQVRAPAYEATLRDFAGAEASLQIAAATNKDRVAPSMALAGKYAAAARDAEKSRHLVGLAISNAYRDRNFDGSNPSQDMLILQTAQNARIIQQNDLIIALLTKLVNKK